MTAGTDTDLAARVAALCDREEVARLPVLYASGLDAEDWELARSVFTDDALIEGSADTLPIDVALARSQRLIPTYACNVHYVANQRVELDGDTALVTSHLVAFHWKVGPAGQAHPENLIAGGRYHDTVVRTGDGWLISHRKVDRDWNHGAQPHLAADSDGDR